jgi:IS4 transposase
VNHVNTANIKCNYYNTERIRIFKYTINNIVYLCATNLFKYTVKKLSKLYKKRWTVEEGFKVFKNYLNKISNNNLTKNTNRAVSKSET